MKIKYYGRAVGLTALVMILVLMTSAPTAKGEIVTLIAMGYAIHVGFLLGQQLGRIHLGN